MKLASTLLLTSTLLLSACDAPPETIAGRIQDGVVKACAFKADYAWLTEVVTKTDATVQMVDQMIDQICGAVTAARGTQTLVSPKCPFGAIEVDGQIVCIEGEPVEGGK